MVKITQRVINNTQIVPVASRNEMGITQGHLDVSVSHHLHELLERHFSGLRQPRGKGVAERVKPDAASIVRDAVIQPQLLHDTTERCADTPLNGTALVGLEDKFMRGAAISGQNLHDIGWSRDGLRLASLGRDVNGQTRGIQILPSDTKNFRGPKSRFEGEQGHIVQLLRPRTQRCKQGSSFLLGQVAGGFVVGTRQREGAMTLDRKRIGSMPSLKLKGMIDGATQQTKTVAHTLWRHGVAQGAFQIAEHLQRDAFQRDGIKAVLEMFAVAISLRSDVLLFSLSPFEVVRDGLADGERRRRQRNLKGRRFRLVRQFFSNFVGISGADSIRMPAHCVPTRFTEGVFVPHHIATIWTVGTRSRRAAFSIKYAFISGFDEL